MLGPGTMVQTATEESNMGYTHYWSQKRNFTTAEWRSITAASTAVLANAAKDGISDGDATDWEHGLALARAAADTVTLAIPPELRGETT